ncbi:MAG: hypothetical protein WDW38_003662 [Sanguina aurantia]
MAASSHTPLLAFPDPLERLQAKPLDLKTLLSFRRDIDPGFLEVLSHQRSSALLQPQGCALDDAVLQWVESLQQELALVYTAYAAAVRHLALQGAATLTSPSNSSGSSKPSTPPSSPQPSPAEVVTTSTAAAAAAAAAKPGSGSRPSIPGSNNVDPAAAAMSAVVLGLRQAAGVYLYLSDTLLPRANSVDSNRPLELHSKCAECMSYCCLAEAQAVAAWRMEEKHGSHGTLAALHAGCAELFSSAVSAAKQFQAVGYSRHSTEHLYRYLSSSHQLHIGRAFACMAREQFVLLEMGQAEAFCAAAHASLKLAESTAWANGRGDQAWRAIILQDVNELLPLYTAVQKDRTAIYYQPLPSGTAVMAPGKVLMQPAVFQPTLTPPARPDPSKVQAASSNCVVM